MKEQHDYEFFTDNVIFSNLYDILNIQSVHDIVWHKGSDRVGNVNPSQDEKWANSWMELIILMSETLDEH